MVCMPLAYLFTSSFFVSIPFCVWNRILVLSLTKIEFFVCMQGHEFVLVNNSRFVVIHFKFYVGFMYHQFTPTTWAPERNLLIHKIIIFHVNIWHIEKIKFYQVEKFMMNYCHVIYLLKNFIGFFLLKKFQINELR